LTGLGACAGVLSRNVVARFRSVMFGYRGFGAGGSGSWIGAGKERHRLAAGRSGIDRSPHDEGDGRPTTRVNRRGKKVSTFGR
jgi:hypothetical protein